MRTIVFCVAGAIATGVLLTLALPLGERGFLAWIALVPLLAATQGRGFLLGFVTALASIFVAAGVAISSVVYDRRAEGLDGWLLTGFGLFGFAMALVVALWADRSAEGKPAWWFASVAVLLEAVLLVQLPAHLALTQYRTQPVVMLAAVVGIWGVSWLVWWTNLAISRMDLRKGALCGGGLCTLGALLGQVALPSPPGERVRFGIVQTEQVDEKELTALHLQASKAGAEVVVWPEFAGMLIALPSGTGPLKEIAGLPGSAPFVTSFRDDHQPLPHNVAALFSGEGESPRYLKRRLFGSENAMHTAGSSPTAVTLNGRTYGLNICFDSCFPSILRDTARLPDVGAILLPTIDPPSRHGFIAAMHAAYSPFRAAELGVPIVRADGYAFSSFVDGNGRILETLAPGEAVAVREIPVGARFSPSRILGDWWLYLCGIAVAVQLVIDFRKRRRRPTVSDVEAPPS